MKLLVSDNLGEQLLDSRFVSRFVRAFYFHQGGLSWTFGLQAEPKLGVYRLLPGLEVDLSHENCLEIIFKVGRDS